MTSLASLGPAAVSLLAVVLCAACGARSDLEGASGASAKGIVVDENSVYWVHYATTVMKLDK